MGLRPMPRSRGAVSMGLRAPQWIRYSGAPRPAPRHERRELYMGLRPMPHLGFFFGKKNPKNPKKPNWIRYILSSIDSEQGCRRQPCFMFGAHSAAPQPPRCPTRLPFVPHPPPVRTRRTHPAKALKLQAFGFFAKHFKLCGRLSELK